MNIDTYHEILYYLDINDIQSLCTSNKSGLKICNSIEFWINIFNRDKLTIFKNGLDYDDWINEYNKSLKASLMAKYLLELLIKEAGQSIVNRFSIAFISLTSIMTLLPIKVVNHLGLDVSKLIIYTEWVNSIFKHYVSLSDVRNENLIEMSYTEMLNLLTKIFYNVPYINILDERDYPYIIHFNQKIDIHNELNPNFYRKKLSDRKLYWTSKNIF